MLTPILLSIHLLSAALWVGGMFFAYFALRPAAASVLEPQLRLTLWQHSFSRFFPWVWIFVLILPVSGYLMIFSLYGGMANTPPIIHVMQLTGWSMFIIYAHLYWGPYKKMSQLLSEGKLPEAAQCLNSIRKLVAINLTLGILTIVLASTTHFK